MDEVWKTVGSLMAAMALLLNLLPWPLRQKLDHLLRRLCHRLFSTSDPFAYVRIPAAAASALQRLHLTSSSSSFLLLHDNSSYHHHLHSLTNPLYDDVSLYLSSLDLHLRSNHLNVYGLHLPTSSTSSAASSSASASASASASNDDDVDTSSRSFLFGLPSGHTLDDTFQGARVWWTHTSSTTSSSSSSSSPSSPSPCHDDSSSSSNHDDNINNNNHNNNHNNPVFVLTMLNSDKPRLLKPYLAHISAVAQSLRDRNKLLTYYTNRAHGAAWAPSLFKHPSTFHTIALPHEDLAQRIRADLLAFSQSQAFYHRIGRPWKRGYLLYGPPGTGKSSLIAAIANFMHYDVYDLELTNVHSNTELKQLLMQTKPKSIVVIEDIDSAAAAAATISRDGPHGHHHDDYSVDGHGYGRGKQHQQQLLTLSGLLNFADGLMSSFGEERIFIFTTNHRERLDTALLRCGRMDMHILLSYCSFSALKKLVFNYLQGLAEHPLFGELELAMAEAHITPASVAEILIRDRKDPDEALRQVLAAAKCSSSADAAAAALAEKPKKDPTTDQNQETQ